MHLKATDAGLPCAGFRFSRRLGRLLPCRPAVDCGRDCAACPWNPGEQVRRLTLGVWRRDERGLRRLCFPPAPAGEDRGDPARKGESS